MKNMKRNIIILVIICSIVLYISLKDDFNIIMGQLYEINLWWFLLSCLLMLGFFFFRTVEMYDLTRQVDKDYPFHKALGIVIIGQFFANITPSSLGTQPAQIYFLNKDGIKASHGTRIVIQYNATYQIALLIISLVTIILATKLNTFLGIALPFAVKELVIISFAIHFVVLLILLGTNYSKGTNSFLIRNIIKMLSFFKFVKNENATQKDWENHLNDFHDKSHRLFKNKKSLFLGILCNIFAIMCIYIIPIFLVYAIGDFHSLEVVGTTIASSYTTIISSFMPSPGGSGGFEYFFTQFFGVFITGATLTTLMLLWRSVTYYFVLLIGSIMLIFYKERNVAA